MKPKNFPGKKNDRRIRQLNKLNYIKEKKSDEEKDIKNLENKIMAPLDAKNIKTKRNNKKN